VAQALLQLREGEAPFANDVQVNEHLPDVVDVFCCRLHSNGRQRCFLELVALHITLEILHIELF
jgi:hypothetical protein